METELVPATGLLMMFVLGLRHGFDPDHIAMIDSMVYRSLAERPRGADWIGTLFALGHGLTVTLIAIGLGSLAGRLPLPAAAITLLEWLPVALLLVVGSINLHALLAAQDYRPSGWKTRLLPRYLRNSSHPLASFAIGVLFALVFDTATQAAAWGYAASAHGGAGMALLVGLAFTAGMVVTDTLDGRLMVHLLRRAAGLGDLLVYRRTIGWLVVALSYGVAVYSIAAHFIPTFEAGDVLLTAAGLSMFACLLAACLWQLRRRPA